MRETGGRRGAPRSGGRAERPERREFLDFHRPSLGAAEEAAVLAVLRSGWLTTGARAAEFEAAVARHVGAAHAVALSSCTAALHLALKVLGVGPGDEVLLPTTTFAATANVAVHLGARPVLCDIDPVTMTLDPADVRARITPRARALVPVHLGGYPAAMAELGALAERHGLAVVEDAAHALDTTIGGRRAGTLGACGTYSFYPTKSITTGEGGMLVTGRADLAERARLLALHGMSRDAWKRYNRDGSPHYEVLEPGFKYNLSDLAAALGLAQLERAEAFYAARRRLALAYAKALGGLPVSWQPLEAGGEGGRVGHHLFILVLDPAARLGRDALAEALRARQVGTSVHFRPLHLMPYYAETYGYRPGDLPRAERVYERALSLPLYPEMTLADVERVAGAIRELIG